MTNVEIDMIVTDSLEALKLYERIFEIKRIEITDFPKGLNETVFSIYGTQFHLLDENAAYSMIAPKAGSAIPIWFNITVPDIQSTYAKAMEAGCTEIQPVTDMPDFGMSNAMFSDIYGYTWMLHQVYKTVTFEERVELMKRNMGDS